MYSTIQEAWNNDHMELYTNNFKQSKFNTPSSNNYFNIHENYGGIITKKNRINQLGKLETHLRP